MRNNNSGLAKGDELVKKATSTKDSTFSLYRILNDNGQQ